MPESFLSVICRVETSVHAAHEHRGQIPCLYNSTTAKRVTSAENLALHLCLCSDSAITLQGRMPCFLMPSRLQDCADSYQSAKSLSVAVFFYPDSHGWGPVHVRLNSHGARCTVSLRAAYPTHPLVSD